MSDAVIVGLISAAVTLIGLVVTSRSQAKEIDHKLDKSQAVTETKLEELTREVRTHNGFAVKIPAIEEQIKAMQNDIAELKRR